MPCHRFANCDSVTLVPQFFRVQKIWEGVLKIIAFNFYDVQTVLYRGITLPVHNGFAAEISVTEKLHCTLNASLHYLVTP